MCCSQKNLALDFNLAVGRVRAWRRSGVRENSEALRSRHCIGVGRRTDGFTSVQRLNLWRVLTLVTQHTAGPGIYWLHVEGIFRGSLQKEDHHS